MGKNDIATGKWLSDKKRFADLFNGSFFGGRQMIDPEGLTLSPPDQKIVLEDKRGREVTLYGYRDIMMQYKEGIRLCLLACENQAEVHYAMVVRNMLYDAVNYAEQIRCLRKINHDGKKLKSSAEFLSGMTKEDKLTPVMTAVLYYGEEKEWDAATDLYELLGMKGHNNFLIPYVSNYKINLIEPGKMKDFSCFKSDLQPVLGMLKYRKNKEQLMNYILEHKDYFSDIDEDTYNAIKVFIKSDKKLASVRRNNQTGGINMCKALDDLYQDGIDTGREGTILELLKEGIISIQVAAEKLGLSVEELEKRKI